MNLTLKNVPDSIHRALKREAAEHRRSLNTEAILALAARVDEAERRRKMRASRAALERFVAKLPKVSDSAQLIREDRRRH